MLAFVILVLIVSSCNLPESSEIAASPPTSTQPESFTVIPPTLDAFPLIWFAPLPPLPVVEGRPFTGSDDYMELFEPDAPWEKAAGRVHVLKLYGEWVGYATEFQLKKVIQNAQSRGFALAMEFGPLDADGCGEGIEGFSGVSYAVSAAKRIKSAGGTLQFLAMDEPYYFGHFYDGPNACHWSAEKIAQEVDQFSNAMKAVFPEILIGDTEALAGAAGADEFKAWIETFRNVNGYDLAFLHMDVDWSRPNWMDEVIAIEEHGNQLDVPVGIIYAGNSFDPTDEEWLSAAGERVKKLEVERNAGLDHILFQSWNDKPDHTLPETQEFTFTDFINDYFENKSGLGYRREGEGANLALGKVTRVSNAVDNLTGAFAVDGDLGTLWNSGGGPTQWIEIDLGTEYGILRIELTPSQFPEGETVHRLLAAGSNRQFSEVNVFEGFTSDGQELVFQPASPILSVQFVRVETTVSPSWVAWREIELIAAGD
jgi:hypothetical protein